MMTPFDLVGAASMSGAISVGQRLTGLSLLSFVLCCQSDTKWMTHNGGHSHISTCTCVQLLVSNTWTTLTVAAADSDSVQLYIYIYIYIYIMVMCLFKSLHKKYKLELRKTNTAGRQTRSLSLAQNTVNAYNFE